MRRMLALVLILALLCGCSAAAPSPTGTVPIGDRVPVGEQGDLWYLPNGTVEAMPVRQLLATEDGLLLWGDGELKLLSQEDLSVKAETTLEASDMAYVQVLEEGVCVADPGMGTVTMLTFGLEVSAVHSPERAGQLWLMGTAGETLYQIGDDGIRAVSLGGEAAQPIVQTRQLYPVILTGERFVTAAVGTEDLLMRWYGLELSDGSLRELEGTQKNALSGGLLPLARGHYLRLDGRELTLFDANGGFVSRCALPAGEGRGCGTDFIWSDRWQGWFFIDHAPDGNSLLFWEPSAERAGESIDLAPQAAPEGKLLEAQLYDRAAELSERYDLDIRIADRCVRDYDSYTAEMLTDPELIGQTLDILEDVLGRYPEGFFRQLRYNDVETIRIEIIDRLKQKENADVSSGDLAYSQPRQGYYLVVLNGRYMRESLICHEIAHIIDRRVAWDARIREEALYSDEGWMALQPEGFAYANSYQNIPDSVKAFYDSGYFVQDYSCVSATEDKAMMLEKAMLGDGAVFEENPRLMPKLEYYCACIRDSFDTSGWPEVTPWERLLPQK